MNVIAKNYATLTNTKAKYSFWRQIMKKNASSKQFKKLQQAINNFKNNEKKFNFIRKALYSDNKLISELGFEALKEIGIDDTVTILLEGGSIECEHSCLSECIYDYLNEKIDEDSISKLVHIFSDRDAKRKKRMKALRIFTEIRHPFAFDRMLRLIEDDDLENFILEELIFALGEYSNEKAVKPLLRLSPNVNRISYNRIIEALGKIGSEKGITLMLEGLKDRDWVTRNISAVSLGYLNDKKAIKPLMKCLNDKVGDVKISAIQSLAKIIDLESLRQLINYYEKSVDLSELGAHKN
jgi:HEAT repeat protein